MFYIDGISLNKISSELNERLSQRKLTKFVQTTDLSLSIYFGKLELVLSCNPNFSICYINDTKEDNLDTNNNFITNLKKHLLGAILIGVNQIGYDRILKFNFLKLTELGEYKKYSIYFEMMGKYSNIILVNDENKIVDLLKKFSLEENRLRTLFSGVDYQLPQIIEKISPRDIDEDSFNKFYNENILIQKVEGIGKFLNNNLKDFNTFLDILDSDIKAKIYIKDKKNILATVLDILPKENYDKILEFDSYTEMINYYITSQKLSDSFETLRKMLNSTVQKNIKKIEKTLNKIENDINNNLNYERYKELGDILASCLYNIKKGMSEIDTFDFYQNKNITIPLEVNKTPQENLELIYKKYNKSKKSMIISLERQKQLKNTLEYLNSVITFIENSENTENLKLILEELEKGKYITIKKKVNNKKKRVKKIDFGVVDKGEYKIFFGRNNIENDNLTFKIADRNDYWFHSKDIPGAHVILKSDGSITEEMILSACKVASYFTKSNVGENIKIDYTLKKYINKPNGANLGFVTYINEKSMVVRKPEDLSKI